MGYSAGFTIGVMDGDRLVRPPSTTQTDAPSPPVITTGDDQDVWPMSGPPPETAPEGMEPGDTWIDLNSGEVYQLN